MLEKTLLHCRSAAEVQPKRGPGSPRPETVTLRPASPRHESLPGLCRIFERGQWSTGIMEFKLFNKLVVSNVRDAVT
jgi:hypothetical protein